MPPEPLLAAVVGPDGPYGPQGPDAPSPAESATPRNAKQRKRDFRRDRRRRRRITERLASDPTLTDCTKVVALAALAYSDDSAKPAYPAMEAIAEAASCHRRSARRCMVDLVEAGYIRRIQRPIAARRNATNLYYFCEPLGPPAPHREGQRRVSRKRIGRIPPDAQNPSSHRRTAAPPEPAKQVPNRPETEPSDSTHSASTSENGTTRPATPESSSSGPLQTPEPTTETHRELAHTHLRAAREALRDPNDPHNRLHRTLTT